MKEPQPLDFEKPIMELQRRLQEIRDHSDEHALDFDAEVEAMEAKIETTRREIYGNLSAWQRVQIARHTQRPFALDYVERCFTNWNELHGDRLFGDDKAMPCGIAMLGEQRCVVITNQKGRNTKENVMRNFGCAHPEGYRKALRLMQLGEKFNLPVISLVADHVMILENAYYSVISPEACSAILWKDRRHAAEAAEALKLTGQDLMKLNVVDEVVAEPDGGAHRDHEKAAQILREALRSNLKRLLKTPINQLLKKRYEKFRRLGNFAEPPRGNGATG
ncbi:MAG: hypothetical protein AUG81_06040 [Verrucomicrobia bacterium 13_1_20CM_4_54_11]|nr:MAG: hypothetical protein AUG81_06040 [Verrucomicrobia bacterium 13_1_20CM_4_54_11]